MDITPIFLFRPVCGVGLAKQPNIPLQWRGRWRWGSWQRTSGGWSDRREPTKKTIQSRPDNDMKMSAEKCATQIPFTLSQCGVPTLGKCGSMCDLCTVMCAPEKCASARVQVGVVSTRTNRRSYLSLSWHKINTAFGCALACKSVASLGRCLSSTKSCQYSFSVCSKCMPWTPAPFTTCPCFTCCFVHLFWFSSPPNFSFNVRNMMNLSEKMRTKNHCSVHRKTIELPWASRTRKRARVSACDVSVLLMRKTVDGRECWEERKSAGKSKRREREKEQLGKGKWKGAPAAGDPTCVQSQQINTTDNKKPTTQADAHPSLQLLLPVHMNFI